MKRQRTTWYQKRGLQIALLMDRQGSPAFLPTFAADSLSRRGWVEVLGTPTTSLGLERLVKLTDTGRDLAAQLEK
jgi:hypothetical protein